MPTGQAVEDQKIVTSCDFRALNTYSRCVGSCNCHKHCWGFYSMHSIGVESSGIKEREWRKGVVEWEPTTFEETSCIT